MKSYLLAFIPVFVAVDALGTAPVLLSLMQGMSAEERSRVIRQSVWTAIGIALGFLWIGKWLFRLLGITVADFLIAGGSILFILAIEELLRGGGSATMPKSIGVVPLATPLIVGPGVLTTVLISADSFGLWPTVTSIVINVVISGLLFQGAERLVRLTGRAGAEAASKIFSLLLAAIGVMMVRRGIVVTIAAYHM